uniref:acetyl-CoA carboxytransferase n=1 Tax=Chromera velia CCMP2878 TaxID=1169474 RepID=A0A0G4HNQ6_9ALVE|eukprot:Cvel_29624.t1-p1 / transcript=Cvel_29624.t1 / gene=Cvel_29624 / organism=Chromera_velia_CCMP2878 / gene_product=Acetyl-coenzyme A carboxylase carboxyl transferase, putative / transcript_product=Acetyl-coenzyme A carboxylase carboxyl transferase, putative / location=Cvel_scaffold4086:243-6242(-) / protein_length=957 / sequence_SO=supercontig / SO=protein_coding / is_pseudo=false
MSTEEKRTPLFEEVCSEDFLKFKFGARGYIDQLNDAITKTGHLAGVKVDLVEILAEGPAPIQIVWVSHNFAFLGGSLGCAEGEKITRAFEYGMEKKLPVVVECRSGGARMQEGTSSLMQMAKVAVAVQAFQAKGLPFVAILCDPTYGGVSASYAMQADCRIAVADARIGFAGPQVILNTMCEGNQKLYDAQCPSDFQAAKFLYENGQVDCVVESAKVTDTVARLLRSLLLRKPEPSPANEGHANPPEKPDMSLFNYTRARKIDRPQTQDLIRELFTDFVEMAGDGKVGLDVCVKGGIAAFRGHPCVVIATSKGHTPGDMQKANYGMPSPHGYRTAYRLMQTAERFSIPVVTLIDTVGAYPNFQSEKEGQSEAIASNLTLMAGLKVPIISLLVGEGGSGGALGLCMGNVIGMLSGGYFGVISPEGAASILGRYDDEEHKAKQFPLDCQELARAQCIYATQLKDLGVVDQVVWEPVHDLGAVESSAEETFQNFPKLKSRIEKFLSDSIGVLSSKSVDQLLTERYAKYRSIGTFKLCTSEEERQKAVEAAKAASQAAVARGAGKRASTAGDKKGGETSAPVIKQLAEETVVGTRSRYLHLAPDHIHEAATALESYFQTHKFDPPPTATGEPTTAKGILDKYGPEHLAQWVMKEAKNRVFLTDTSMRDAHQSLLATRVRTVDIVNAARVASNVLKDGFSLECWGGATFDVAMRFLDECPWERLREVRKACPNICTQMLIRGANAVGYTSYPDDVVEEFVRLAAKNGMDVFRIFDCFNSVDSMRVCIDAVRATGKVAEVCICYTGNLLSSKIYHVDYYRELAKEIKAAGAHFIAIKDMAGLLRPLEVEPLMKAVREGSGGSLPIHFHMHATSSGALATLMEMTRCECEIVDVCAASIADGTSQPSMDAFVAMTEGGPRQTKMKFMDLAPYEELWARIRCVGACVGKSCTAMFVVFSLVRVTG